MDIEKHPCFGDNCNRYARIHLPVAPRCNIKCNYCKTNFDCVNESRPGVTSKVLTPQEAVSMCDLAIKKIANLTVVGIAGPGDALANFSQVQETLQKLHSQNPNLDFCLSTNGLNLTTYLPKLLKLKVKYITITVNAIEQTIGEQIYEHIFWQGRKYLQRDAFSILSQNQLEGIKVAVEAGICCKVNTVVIPGINDKEIVKISKKAASLGCHMQNLIPMLSVAGTAFEKISSCDSALLDTLRQQGSRYIKQMYHCQRCRSDAVGTLSYDRFAEFYERKDKPILATINYS